MLALVAFIFWQTAELPEDSALFPRLFALVLAGVSLALIAQSLWGYYRSIRTRVEQKKSKKPVELEKPYRQYLPFALIAFCLLFIFAFPRIGFELGAFALVLATMLLIDPKEGIRKIYIAVAAPAVILLIFKVGIKLRIPLLLEKILQR